MLTPKQCPPPPPYFAQFSLGYFLNDLFLILQYPAVGGYDMLFHHIIVGIFFTSGLLDRWLLPPP